MEWGSRVRRRWALVLVLAALVAAGAWSSLDESNEHKTSAESVRVNRFGLHSALLDRSLEELLVTPPGGGRGRALLIFLHGRGARPDRTLSDRFFAGLRGLGRRAPVVLLADSGNHSYWHDRADGRWGSYVLREAIPAALARSGADANRVAVGGVSMGGFGALDLARIAPHRFCAVGGHSAALWFQGGDTPQGTFDDEADFERHDVLASARGRSPYRAPVWLDVGDRDPFLKADTALARELRAGGARVSFHVWPGGHGPTYWDDHIARYLRFYAVACG